VLVVVGGGGGGSSSSSIYTCLTINFSCLGNVLWRMCRSRLCGLTIHKVIYENVTVYENSF
jgi:hypothetical protein